MAPSRGGALWSPPLRPSRIELPTPALSRDVMAGATVPLAGGDLKLGYARQTKEAACGCAGLFNAPYALESYVTVFDEEGALDKFEGFASLHGPAFYGLPVNDSTVTLDKAPVVVPEVIDAKGTPIVPFHAGEELGWRFVG